MQLHQNSISIDTTKFILDIDPILVYNEHMLLKDGLIEPPVLGVYQIGRRAPLATYPTPIKMSNDTYLDYSNIPYNQGVHLLTNDDIVLVYAHQLVDDGNQLQISNKPIHSYYLYNIILDIIDYIQYNGNPYKQLYLSDPMNISGHIPFIPEHIPEYVYMEDILLKWLPNTSNEYRHRFLKSLENNGLQELYSYMSITPNYIFGYEYDRDVLTVYRDMDIMAKRYKLNIEIHTDRILEAQTENLELGNKSILEEDDVQRYT